MPLFRNMTIKYKLILIIMLACITGLMLAGVAFISWEWNTFRNNIVRNVSTQTEMIAENCKAALAFQDAEDAKVTLSALHVEPSIIFGGIYTKDNKLFATYYRGYAEIKVHPDTLLGKGFSFDNGFLNVFRPIVLDGEIIGTVCLRSDLSPMYTMLKRNASVIIAVLFFSSFIAFLMSSLLQNVISGPILSLAKVAKDVSEKKDYSTRAVRQSNDEVGLLINSFNEMLEQIQRRDAELVDSKEKLEVRVEERTAELTTTNEQLTQEITERKNAEEQLRKAEEKYRTQFEGALDAIIVADAETGIIIDCNPAATRLVDREKSELIGKSHTILHPPERIKGEFSDTFSQHILEKRGQTLETRVITKTGQLRDVAIKATLLEFRGRKILQGIFRDISENKKAELRQAQLLEQLEKTNQELKDFAYIVSHDLKAPLRGIKTITEWITADYSDKLDENGREQIRLLASRVDRMHNLIDGILQYSRAGRVDEEKAMVNLNELIADIIDLIAPPENIKITIENELPTIQCEQTRIRQVVQNLLTNAIKYMDKPKGSIKIGCVEENGFWKFSVADNGPGIEEKHFEKIFQLFQTLTPRDEFESTGIGLSIIKKIVEMYGGKIWVTSKIGEGCTFFFTLPVTPLAAAK
ncbi:MAG: ATP-binding protein [Phycisphaerae bacterium]|nr:ATP-binding protein [Phycisphaerae bacterium]